MSEIVKTILSPETIKELDRIGQTRADTTDRLKDEIRREARLLGPDGDADVTSPEVQAGRRLPRSLILTRLKKLNPHLRYAQSQRYPEHGGIYVADRSCEFVTDAVPGRFICGIPHELVNEFDVRIAVPDVIPDPDIALHWQQIKKLDAHEPGWLSILLKLAKEGLINLTRAETLFHVHDGRSSRNYQQAVN